jgi:hypothetical protein
MVHYVLYVELSAPLEISFSDSYDQGHSMVISTSIALTQLNNQKQHDSNR